MSTPLELPELLESILQHVDIKTLLLAQAVNRRFRVCIRDSIRLQQKLFFIPIPDKGQKFEYNPLLVLDRDGTLKPYGGLAPAFLLARHVRHLRIFDNTSDIAQPSQWEIKAALGGSWRHMLLRQPPHPITHILYQLNMSGTRLYKFSLPAPVQQEAGALFDYTAQQARAQRRVEGEAEDEDKELAYFQHIQSRARLLWQYRGDIEQAKAEKAKLREEIEASTAALMDLEVQRLVIEESKGMKLSHGYELKAMPTVALAILVSRGVKELRARARKGGRP